MNTTFADMDGFLQHWGILGMKWGIRRYQNPDGSLTPAGRKRYEKEVIEKEEAAVNKNYSDNVSKPSSAEPSSQKSISEMTDDELRSFINRKNLEKQYLNAMNEGQSNGPSQVITSTKKRNSSEMTDQELRDFLNRVSMEKQYNDIVNPPKKESAVISFIKTVGSSALTTVAKKWATQALERVVFGNKTAQAVAETADKAKQTKQEIAQVLKEMNDSNDKRFKNIEGLLTSGEKESKKEAKKQEKEERKQEREERRLAEIEERKQTESEREERRKEQEDRREERRKQKEYDDYVKHIEREERRNEKQWQTWQRQEQKDQERKLNDTRKKISDWYNGVSEEDSKVISDEGKRALPSLMDSLSPRVRDAVSSLYDNKSSNNSVSSSLSSIGSDGYGQTRSGIWLKANASRPATSSISSNSRSNALDFLSRNANVDADGWQQTRSGIWLKG